ncbi:MAG TPA: radical SAM family heme chaperone HemW [Bacteroidota bacterium]|nr:radical SAM family heme chaperone HemW [Bacteroidota bacterium]
MASLYLHIPFCEHKCVYCDFYSLATNGSDSQDAGRYDRFVAALKREIELRAADPRFASTYDTIFFGGGTPSLLSASHIEAILNLLHKRFIIADHPEITMEANPGTLERGRLADFRRAGITRLSMGIQSFFDDDLKFLSRIHTAREAKDCVREALRVGFDSVSFDLIFALPSQTLERWESNLRQAVELSPNHLSCYSLIVEPHTPLQRMVESQQVQLPSEDVDAEMYERTIDFLTTQGYRQYEISNFARPGHECRHNLAYWTHQNYLGFGPSAHSFWNDRRFWNVPSLQRYLESLEGGSLAESGSEVLLSDQLIEEEIFLGLRSSGIDLQRFEKRHGIALLSVARKQINQFIDDGLVVVEEGRIRSTKKGYMLCDEIASSLIRFHPHPETRLEVHAFSPYIAHSCSSA